MDVSPSLVGTLFEATCQFISRRTCFYQGSGGGVHDAAVVGGPGGVSAGMGPTNP